MPRKSAKVDYSHHFLNWKLAIILKLLGTVVIFQNICQCQMVKYQQKGLITGILMWNIKALALTVQKLLARSQIYSMTEWQTGQKQYPPPPWSSSPGIKILSYNDNTCLFYQLAWWLRSSWPLMKAALFHTILSIQRPVNTCNIHTIILHCIFCIQYCYIHAI